MPFKETQTRLTFSHDSETLVIDPWGPNAFRVRATQLSTLPSENWALLSPVPEPDQVKPHFHTEPDGAHTISNGNVSANVSKTGKLTICNTKAGKHILEEYTRNRRNVLDAGASALEIEARDFKAIVGSDSFHLTARFESLDPREKIYGMGQYQQRCMDLKGCDLELAQRNSQVKCSDVMYS